MTFDYPSIWFLTLLVVLPFMAWRMFARRPAAIQFSSTQTAKKLAPTWRMRLRWLLPVLRLTALAMLIVSLARPQFGRTQTTIDSEGIAIQMVVDRSGSMRALDFKLDGHPVDRLTALKKVAGDFIQGGDGLPGRTNDLMGLITFARFADAASPLTLDHSFAVSRLQDTEIVVEEQEDGTAIGDALGLGIERLKALDESRKSEKQGEVKSKIIVLLTDGTNTAGEMEPEAAAKLAESLGIRIYTIGVGTRGEAPFPVRTYDGREVLRPVMVTIDEELLTKIAETSGGKYFRATDTDSLKKIYEAIDQLEKTRVEEKQYTDYRELAIQPWHDGGISFPPLVLLSFGLLASECLLAASVFRGIP